MKYLYSALLVALMLSLLAGRSTHTYAPGTACSQPVSITALSSGSHRSILIGTTTGRIYRARTTPLHCTTSFLSTPLSTSIGFVIDPPHYPQRLLVGGLALLSPTTGLFYSDDGGHTWVESKLNGKAASILPTHLTITPHQALLLSYICDTRRAAHMSCRAGLARSSDGGISWQMIGPSGAPVDGLAATADGSLIALVAAPPYSPWPFLVYRSQDDGFTWKNDGRALGIRHRFDLSALFSIPWRPHTVLAGEGIALLAPAVERSRDTGVHWSRTWHRRTNLSSGDSAVISFAGVDPTHTIVLSTFGGMYRSIDDGATWMRARLNPPLNNQRVWALLTSADGKTVYAGTTGGLYRSTDSGKGWTLT